MYIVVFVISRAIYRPFTMKNTSTITLRNLYLFLLLTSGLCAQVTNNSEILRPTEDTIPFQRIGKIQARNANQIESSNWLIGCETLDRDYADYDAYKEYLNPLGIKHIRLQAGWDKTEKVKGTYDWGWLDHIINDATKRGLKPWLQTSYGNHNYPDGGGANLGAGMPKSDEALQAWDKWVAALVNRYKDKVKDWEVWNEPNFSDNTENTPEKTAMLNIRTAEIIKSIQPEARISGLSLGHISLGYTEAFAKVLFEKGKMNLFDNMVYHDYVYNPDSNYKEVEAFKSIFHRYSPTMKIRQGENGAPSKGRSGGALWDYDWTEVTQAKWNLRRMLGNLGHDIECSVFSIIDMAYTAGPINRLNHKGLIQSDSTKKVIKPKLAYYAVQNVASVFDHSLERISNLQHSHNKEIMPTDLNTVYYSKSTDRSVSVYGYRHKASRKQVYTLWIDDYIPTESNSKRKIDFSFIGGDFDQPVYVDMISGLIYEIPVHQWSKKGIIFSFSGIPVYDSPILIVDKSLIASIK